MGAAHPHILLADLGSMPRSDMLDHIPTAESMIVPPSVTGSSGGSRPGPPISSATAAAAFLQLATVRW